MEDDRDDNFQSFFPRKPSVYDMNSKVMLTAILSLMIVVVLVVTLHIYARCVLGRQARRRAALRGLSLRVARLHSMIEQPKRAGLDPTVIASLPVFKYKGDGDGHEADPVRPECSVCLSLLEDEEIARLLPNCNHIFHAECIDKWLGSHTTCPVCRAEAKPRMQPEPREPPSLVPVQPHQLNSNGSNSNCMEGTSEDSARALINKSTGGSSSRFNSFRRILTRERSSQRLGQMRSIDDDVEDPESLRL